MKAIQSFTLVFLISFGIISCGDSEAMATSKTEAGAEKAVAKSKAIDPCDLLSESEIKKILSIPDNAVTKIKESGSSFPTCIYKWEEVTYLKGMTFGGNEVEIEYPSELYIIVVENAHKGMFEQSTVAYKDGLGVDGIGEMAMWGEKMSQVTFLAKGYLVHVKVRVASETTENKEKALQLSKRLIENL